MADPMADPTKMTELMNDEHEQDRDEGNDDELSGPCREPDNVTVQDLLCLLGPILAVRPDPPPTIAPNA
jgi:hypothetical protein